MSLWQAGMGFGRHIPTPAPCQGNLLAHFPGQEPHVPHDLERSSSASAPRDTGLGKEHSLCLEGAFERSSHLPGSTAQIPAQFGVSLSLRGVWKSRPLQGLSLAWGQSSGAS